MNVFDELIVLLDKPDDEIWGQYYIDDAIKLYKQNHEVLLLKLKNSWLSWEQDRQMHLACILGVVGSPLELELINGLLQSPNRHIANYAKDALDEFQSNA